MPLRPWKRGTAAQRAANTGVAGAGEIGVETDTGNLVVGDGATLWSNLKRLVRVDEVTTAVQQYVTSLVVTNATLTALAAESGYAYAVTDSAGRAALGVKLDGTVVVPKLSIGAGAIQMDALSAAVQAGLLQVLPAESGYVWGVVDTSGRLALGIKVDGSVIAPKFATNIPSMRAAESSTYLAHPFVDTSGRYQLRVTRRSDGQVTILSSGTTNTIEPTLTEDDKLLFRTDSTGSMVGMWRKADGTGSSWLLAPTTDILAEGDSLTAGAGGSGGSLTYPATLGTALGVTVVNDGQGGTTGACIAARANGQPFTTTASVTVPAGTTSVAVTMSVLGSSSAASWSRTGTLAGIPGTLTWTQASSTFAFARTTAGSSTVVPSGSTFLTDVGVAAQQNTLSIWLGRNSFTTDSPATTVARVQSILDYHKSYLRRFVVLEIPPMVGEETGAGTAPRGANRDALDATNAALLAAYPGNFVAVATYLRSAQAAIDAGITFTTQDNTDIANGLTPTSFRSDTLHLKDISYPLVGNFVAASMRAKGWYS